MNTKAHYRYYKEYYDKYRQSHREQLKKYRNKYYNSNRGRKMYKKYAETLNGRFIHWKGNAKIRGHTFELKLKDLQSMPLVCHYTGLALTLECNKYTTISLDRLDNSKGYTKENIVFCCGFINIMKQQLTYNQFILACKMIAQYHDNKELRNN